MTRYCAPRKRRKHPAINHSEKKFYDAVQEGDFKKAARIAFWATLNVAGVNAIMTGFYDGNSSYRRQKKLRGL